MRQPRFNVFLPLLFVILAMLVAVSCSDDDKPTGSAPDPQWRWVAFGTQDYIWATQALGEYDNKLIAAGRYISAWDGSSWTKVAETYGIVMKLSNYNGLIAAGNFTKFYTETGDSIPLNYIASWDGTTWSPLGTGMNADVHGLTVWNGQLVACGNFTTAGGVNANRIAVWNGSTWAPLGSGWNETLDEVIVYNGQLIAGGGTRLIYWNGATWNNVPDQAGITQSGSTPAMTIYDGLLIRSGAFFFDGTEVGYIGAWNGSSWSKLGTGIDDYAWELTVYGEELIAAGRFTTAGGQVVNRIAAWDGTSWRPLGTGVDNDVLALGTWNNRLITCGSFTTAGDVTVEGGAAWGLQ